MSSLIVSFAKPTLFRSRKAMKYKKTMSGSTRRLTLRMVRSPNSPSDSTDIRDPATAASSREKGSRNQPRAGIPHATGGEILLSYVHEQVRAAEMFSWHRGHQGVRCRPWPAAVPAPVRQLLGVGRVKGPCSRRLHF